MSRVAGKPTAVPPSDPSIIVLPHDLDEAMWQAFGVRRGAFTAWRLGGGRLSRPVEHAQKAAVVACRIGGWQPCDIKTYLRMGYDPMRRAYLTHAVTGRELAEAADALLRARLRAIVAEADAQEPPPCP